ncbi:SDR family oxidoreductase [Frateuria aurantia]|uniref:SDR family oxidoreductase n=1 Tax=Frateuria aurantia TaxID=81475 RepID=UPI003CE4C363
MMDRFSGGTPEGRHAVIDQKPVGRMGRPEEIASNVLWLCSKGGDFTVGTAIVVDGGQATRRSRQPSADGAWCCLPAQEQAIANGGCQTRCAAVLNAVLHHAS